MNKIIINTLQFQDIARDILESPLCRDLIKRNKFLVYAELWLECDNESAVEVINEVLPLHEMGRYAPYLHFEMHGITVALRAKYVKDLKYGVNDEAPKATSPRTDADGFYVVPMVKLTELPYDGEADFIANMEYNKLVERCFGCYFIQPPFVDATDLVCMVTKPELIKKLAPKKVATRG